MSKKLLRLFKLFVLLFLLGGLAITLVHVSDERGLWFGAKIRKNARNNRIAGSKEESLQTPSSLQFQTAANQQQRMQPTEQDDSTLNYNVHAFYYAWYGSPEHDGRWWHWNHEYLANWDKNDRKVYPTGAHQPPEDVGANFYPSLGAYSSRNEEVIHAHFKMLRGASVGVISVSWYPPGLADEHGPKSDEIIPTLLRLADLHQLKVCLHVEPYSNRSVENLREHLNYVHETYGSHPAYYKVTRGTKQLPLFYIYDSYRIEPLQWARLFSTKGDLTVRGTELDGVFIALLVELRDRYNIKKGKFDGFYTYFAANGFTYGSSWKNWRDLAGYAYKNSLLFIPSVGPGYIDTRVRPWNSRNTRDRRGGVYYEAAWKTALSTSPRLVSVTSFNEWHEGTQIESAIPFSCDKYTYNSYYPKDPDFYLKMTQNYSRIMLKNLAEKT